MYATWFGYQRVSINQTRTETLSHSVTGEDMLSLMSSPVENKPSSVHVIHNTGVNYRIISGNKLIGASPAYSHFARPVNFVINMEKISISKKAENSV